ncbi:MAG: hypothetical protein JSS60_08095 [Verrucomicrobia bacterium]|nr:hypothetical protein [Verrucomicrobiota bacterium]
MSIASTNALNQTPQENFAPNNIPPNTDAYYNTVGFATNLSAFLATVIQEDQQAQENGLNQIKDAINGQT